MPPSHASTGTPGPLAERPENQGFRIWIPLPVAALGVLLSLVAGLLVLGPGLAGSILVLAFFVLLPGLAVVRLLGLHDAPLEVVLGIALSFAIAGLISVIQAYFGGWSPTLTLGALVATTVAAVLTPLVTSLVRGRRRRPSVLGVPVTGSPVAWPSAAPVSAAAPPAPVTSAAPAQGPGASVDPAPTAPRPTRGRSRGAADLPPPPVAVIRKRPKAAPGSPTAGAGPGTRPNRATRSAIDQLVDELADQRDQTQS